MPLSIAAVLGGTLTLIGTSTNLVVDGIVRDAGMPRFGIFEITPIGLVTAASGMIALAAMWWLLPSDRPVKGDADPADAHHYLTELILQEGDRSEEHTSELQSLMRNSYAVFCLTKKNHTITTKNTKATSLIH